MSCKFCEDRDFFYDIVCYIPTKCGASVDIPLNYCPCCGASITEEDENIAYVRSGYILPKELSDKLIEEAVEFYEKIKDKLPEYLDTLHPISLEERNNV